MGITPDWPLRTYTIDTRRDGTRKHSTRHHVAQLPSLSLCLSMVCLFLSFCVCACVLFLFPVPLSAVRCFLCSTTVCKYTIQVQNQFVTRRLVQPKKIESKARNRVQWLIKKFPKDSNPIIPSLCLPTERDIYLPHIYLHTDVGENNLPSPSVVELTSAAWSVVSATFKILVINGGALGL